MRKRSPTKRRLTRRTALKALPAVASVGGVLGVSRAAADSTTTTDDEPKHLLIEGTGPVTRFSFSVTGTVEGQRLEATDSVSDSRVDGQVSTQDDRYHFTGELESFEITDGNAEDVVLVHDGVETTVAELDG